MRNGPRIIVNSDVLAPAALALLEARGAEVRMLPTRASEAEMIAAVSEAPTHAILVRTTKITPSVYDAAPDLRVVSKHGVGYDNIDVAAASARGIAVLRTHGANARSVAELALGMMISVLRYMVPFDTALRQGTWPQSAYHGPRALGLEARHRRLRRRRLLAGRALPALRSRYPDLRSLHRCPTRSRKASAASMSSTSCWPGPTSSRFIAR